MTDHRQQHSFVISMNISGWLLWVSFCCFASWSLRSSLVSSFHSFCMSWLAALRPPFASLASIAPIRFFGCLLAINLSTVFSSHGFSISSPVALPPPPLASSLVGCLLPILFTNRPRGSGLLVPRAYSCRRSSLSSSTFWSSNEPGIWFQFDHMDNYPLWGDSSLKNSRTLSPMGKHSIWSELEPRAK